MRKVKMPSAETILILLILIVAVLTWILPAGQYSYLPDGAPIAGSYTQVSRSGQSIWAVTRAPLEGFYEAIEVAEEIIITNAGRIEQKGTPVEVYRNPETAFTASFFGQPSVLKNADDFHTFTQAESADKIIVRPEFVKISKLDEVEKFKTSVSRGVVERVSFRGDNLELQVRVNNSVVTARRSLEKADIREGETVNVFLYRIFALKGDSVQLIENEAVRDDFVII